MFWRYWPSFLWYGWYSEAQFGWDASAQIGWYQSYPKLFFLLFSHAPLYFYPWRPSCITSIEGDRNTEIPKWKMQRIFIEKSINNIILPREGPYHDTFWWNPYWNLNWSVQHRPLNVLSNWSSQSRNRNWPTEYFVPQLEIVIKKPQSWASAAGDCF